MKILSLITIFLTTTIMFTGCSGNSVKNSTEATKENPLIFKLPHNQNEQHTVHIAISDFAERVFEKTNGRIRIDIFPNAQLGSENEVLEQLIAGIIPITKVSAPVLAVYEEGYHTFGLPYIFKDQTHYYNCMDSNAMDEFFMSTQNKGFVGLTFYTSGSRSFYTVNKPIRKPEDLKGLKIRVQDMKSQTDMVKVLGGTPVAMSYGEVYTALQTGIIDGTENNETALTSGKHGEVTKVYSFDEHTMIPDIIAMSSKAWNMLTEEDKQIFIESSKESTEIHKEIWESAIDDAIEEAKEKMGVTFIEDVDKEAFRNATKGMIDQYGTKYPKVRELIDAFDKVD